MATRCIAGTDHRQRPVHRGLRPLPADQRLGVGRGYRHLQTLSGGDIIYDPSDPSSIVYPREVRENNDAVQAGFSYTTAKRQIRYGFHSLIVFDGNNSDRKFWVGGSIDIPFGGKHGE